MEQNNLKQEYEDIFGALHEFISQAFDQIGFTLLSQQQRILVLFGFQQQFLEFLVPLNSKKFKLISFRDDHRIQIIKITNIKAKLSLTLCSFSYIKNIEENEKENYVISRVLASHVFSKFQKKEIHYLIFAGSKKIKLKNELEENVSYFKTMTDMPKYQILQKFTDSLPFDPNNFLDEIFKLKYSNLSFFPLKRLDALAEGYIHLITSNFTNKFEQSLEQFYKYLKMASQYIDQNNDTFQLFQDYLEQVQKKLKNSAFNYLKALQIVFESIDNNLQTIFQAAYFQYKQRHSNNQFNFNDFQFGFEFKDFKKLYQEYSHFGFIDWKYIQVLKIKNFIEFQARYTTLAKQNQNFCSFDQAILQIQELQREENPNSIGVFLLGETRVGKSTVINILQNPNNLRVVDLDNYERVFNPMNDTIFQIYHGVGSCPEKRLKHFLHNNYKIYDCPGIQIQILMFKQQYYQIFINNYNNIIIRYWCY